MSVWPAGVDRSIGPLPVSLGAALRAEAARRGEALAIAFYGAEISFAELLRRVERLAAFLLSQQVERADHVRRRVEQRAVQVEEYGVGAGHAAAVGRSCRRCTR